MNLKLLVVSLMVSTGLVFADAQKEKNDKNKTQDQLVAILENMTQEQRSEITKFVHDCLQSSDLSAEERAIVEQMAHDWDWDWKNNEDAEVSHDATQYHNLKRYALYLVGLCCCLGISYYAYTYFFPVEKKNLVNPEKNNQDNSENANQENNNEHASGCSCGKHTQKTNKAAQDIYCFMKKRKNGIRNNNVNNSVEQATVSADAIVSLGQQVLNNHAVNVPLLCDGSVENEPSMVAPEIAIPEIGLGDGEVSTVLDDMSLVDDDTIHSLPNVLKDSNSVGDEASVASNASRWSRESGTLRPKEVLRKPESYSPSMFATQPKRTVTPQELMQDLLQGYNSPSVTD